MKRQFCHQCHATTDTYTTERDTSGPIPRAWHLCAPGTGCEADPTRKLPGYRSAEVGC